MSHAVLTAIVVPLVVAVALAVWITMVYRAERHPGFARSRNSSKQRREVSGGSFRGSGGRQVMPIPGQPPASDDDAGDEPGG